MIENVEMKDGVLCKTPETFIECDELDCYECSVFIEGTYTSRYFASKFEKDNCWTRRQFRRPDWDDPYWSKYDTIH